MIGVGGIVTFKNNKLQELLPVIGLDHVVLETDAPYLAPTLTAVLRMKAAIFL